VILRTDIADDRLALADQICAGDLKTPPISLALTSQVSMVMPLLVCPRC
jgi:hypothetical protein